MTTDKISRESTNFLRKRLNALKKQIKENRALGGNVEKDLVTLRKIKRELRKRWAL